MDDVAQSVSEGEWDDSTMVDGAWKEGDDYGEAWTAGEEKEYTLRKIEEAQAALDARLLSNFHWKLNRQ